MLVVYRKEIKYVLPRIDAIRLESTLSGLLARDEHGPHEGYLVRSQYFDSATDRDYNENLDGVMNRSKIRIRTYPSEHPNDDPPPKTVKLEHKRKSGSDSAKFSLSITPSEALRMERGDVAFLDRFVDGDDALVARTLKAKIVQESYRPRTIVSYRRRAYLYPASNVRLTFDSDIQTSLSPYGLLDYDKCLIGATSADRVVLEVKYNDFLPQFIARVIERMDRSTTANSKYAIVREFTY